MAFAYCVSLLFLFIESIPIDPYKYFMLYQTCSSVGTVAVVALAATLFRLQLMFITCYKLLIAKVSLIPWERAQAQEAFSLHQSHMQLHSCSKNTIKLV